MTYADKLKENAMELVEFAIPRFIETGNCDEVPCSICPFCKGVCTATGGTTVEQLQQKYFNDNYLAFKTVEEVDGLLGRTITNGNFALEIESVSIKNEKLTVNGILAVDLLRQGFKIDGHPFGKLEGRL